MSLRRGQSLLAVMKSLAYQPRAYRAQCRRGGLAIFNVIVAESDLLVMAQKDLAEETRAILHELRAGIEKYINIDREFLTALSPVGVPEHAPSIVKEMAAAAAMFGVGPMAAVAGAISERVAMHLAAHSAEVIVENGGDNFLLCNRNVVTAIYAGDSPLSTRLGIEIEACPAGISICTSSGTVGHSLSFGRADAVTVVARSGSKADAAATAIGNRVGTEADVEEAVAFARRFPDIIGLVVIKNEKIGIYGEAIKVKII